MKLIPVKILKSHPGYAYFEGDTGFVNVKDAEEMVKGGYIVPLPGPEVQAGHKGDAAGDLNGLPVDLPARDKLFEAGYKTIADIKEGGDSLLEIPGISNAVLKKIQKYLEKFVFPDAEKK